MDRSVAFFTLGCKVNQYDSQAMLERFRSAGYRAVPFDSDAGIYVINTCTVTGVGDKKSLQLARRVRREHPDSLLILCGCLAQRKAEALLETGAGLILGTQRRMEVVELAERVLATGKSLCAVEPLGESLRYEPMTIRSQEEHTRAVMKIQEGCGNRCTYCIIPSVRGPIRSRRPEDIKAEALALAQAGFPELVLTGIHLTSYGRDLGDSISLLDGIRAAAVPGIRRIRLGSLEPTVATAAFAEALRDVPGLCPQFHLALQSGSDSVLRRMARRYNMRMYRDAVANIHSVWPDAALTTDILTGFPGETEAEFRETCDVIREVGFARIHVFPYSPREGTPAAVMPGQLTRAEKEARVRELIAVGEETARRWEQRWIGRTAEVLLEVCRDGFWHGYTPEYIPVRVPDAPGLSQGAIIPVCLRDPDAEGMTGIPETGPNT